MLPFMSVIVALPSSSRGLPLRRQAEVVGGTFVEAKRVQHLFDCLNCDLPINLSSVHDCPDFLRERGGGGSFGDGRLPLLLLHRRRLTQSWPPDARPAIEQS